jgi:hypothetical protein
MTGRQTRLPRAPLGPAEAYLRMLAAVGEDLAAALADRDERDHHHHGWRSARRCDWLAHTRAATA